MSGRVFFCPSCGARYDVSRDVVGESNIVLLCGMCGHAARTGGNALEQTPVAPLNVPTAAELSLLESQQPRVVVGHEVPAAARSIAGVLRSAGFSPACVRSGEQVLTACDPAMPAPPAAVVLDVAIPGVLAFEVIEHLRAIPATKALPIVLLASVFERTRYKRRPTNLYGADAYLELHHVPDRLAPLIEEVRANKAPGADRLQAPVERARAAGLRSRSAVVDAEAAQTLARRLLSDVALYHGDELADGVRRGDPFASLAAAVDAARDLFRSAIEAGTQPVTQPPADADNARVRATTLFEEELTRFGQHLLERSARPAGATGGTAGTSRGSLGAPLGGIGAGPGGARPRVEPTDG